MPTITWGGAGGQTATFGDPQELKNFGYPRPPRQPIASWASDLAAFQAMCSAGQYREAIEYATAHWLLVSNADVPGGALAGFKGAIVRQSPSTENAGLPLCLNTAAGQTW